MTMKNNIKKTFFFLILFALLSVPAFGEFINQDGISGGADSPRKLIDSCICFLTLSGIVAGAYKINSAANTNKQT